MPASPEAQQGWRTALFPPTEARCGRCPAIHAPAPAEDEGANPHRAPTCSSHPAPTGDTRLTPAPCIHRTACTPTSPSSRIPCGHTPGAARTGDRGVCTSPVSPTFVPPHHLRDPPASHCPLCPSPLQTCPCPPAMPGWPRVTLSLSSLHPSGLCHPLVPPVVPVTASFTPQSHAILFLQPHSRSKGTA